MLTEALAGVEDLFAVGTTPRESLLMELLLMGLPVWFRLERLVTERTREVLRRGGRHCGYGRETIRGGGRQAIRLGAVVRERRVGRGDRGARVGHHARHPA
jgi:hypothetical protein